MNQKFYHWYTDFSIVFEKKFSWIYKIKISKKEFYFIYETSFTQNLTILIFPYNNLYSNSRLVEFHYFLWVSELGRKTWATKLSTPLITPVSKGDVMANTFAIPVTILFRIINMTMVISRVHKFLLVKWRMSSFGRWIVSSLPTRKRALCAFLYCL